MFNFVLVFVLMTNIATVSSSYASMGCQWDQMQRNYWDGYHNNVQYGTFMAGMHSWHDNGREDRRFKWKYCEPSGHSAIQNIGALSETSWDAQWQRDCSSRNGGNSALVGATSYHDNGKEDRQWTFYCGNLGGNWYFAPGACTWSNYVNDWDAAVNYDCPSNGIMRGISSYHDNGREDRRWRFECCRVSQHNSNPARGNQEMANSNDHVSDSETSGSQNRAFLIIASISAGLCILCVIFSVYLYRRKKRSNAISMHRYSSNAQEEDMTEMVEIAKSDCDGISNIEAVNEETKMTESI